MQRIVRMWVTPITLLLLLGVLGYGAWWGWRNLTRPAAPVQRDPCVTQSVGPDLTPDKVTVRVYNGGGKTGLAKSVRAQLQASGFKVPYHGNASDKITGTVIVGASADYPEVKLVAGFFPESTIRADQRADRSVDVLVGSAFVGFNDKAPTSIPVPGGTVCLPGSQTPSAPAASAATPR